MKIQLTPAYKKIIDAISETTVEIKYGTRTVTWAFAPSFWSTRFQARIYLNIKTSFDRCEAPNAYYDLNESRFVFDVSRHDSSSKRDAIRGAFFDLEEKIEALG